MTPSPTNDSPEGERTDQGVVGVRVDGDDDKLVVDGAVEVLEDVSEEPILC